MNDKTPNSKFNTVRNKNTFYFFDKPFEDQYEGYVNSLSEVLLSLKNDIETNGLKIEETLDNLLMDKEHGLRALLALTGVSNEMLKRITTIIRIVDDEELNRLVFKDKWLQSVDNGSDGSEEWTNSQIKKLIKEDKFFRKGIINIFLKGATVPFLVETIPVFELKKFSISKLKFEMPSMIDTLIRYKEKGSYSGKKGNNPEILIQNILKDQNITYEQGDLKELIKNAPNLKRTMDFIIPNKNNPMIIIECSFLATTSSGQGDKAKTEISVAALIKNYYPSAKFIGFVDGIGWYVRPNDLQRMVTAYSDVFTFHKDELCRFSKLLSEYFPNGRI